MKHVVVRSSFSAFLLAVTLVACTNAPQANLVLVPSENVEMLVGAGVNVAVNAVPNAFTPQVTWVSAEESIAVVESTGANTARISGVQEGVTTVTANVAGSDRELVMSVRVQPVPAAVSAEITDAPETMNVNESVTATGVIRTVGGLEDAGVWGTVTPDILSVNAETGEVTAIGSGYGLLVLTSETDPEVVVAQSITVYENDSATEPALDTITNPLGGEAPEFTVNANDVLIDFGSVTTSVAFKDADGNVIPNDVNDPTFFTPEDGAIEVTITNARLGSIVRVMVGDAATYERVTGESVTIEVGFENAGVLLAGTESSFLRVDAVPSEDDAGSVAFALGFRVVTGSDPAVFGIDVSWVSTPILVGERVEPVVVVRGWSLPNPVPYVVAAVTENLSVADGAVTALGAGMGTIRVTSFGFEVTSDIMIVNPPFDAAPEFINATVNGDGSVLVTWEYVGDVVLESSLNNGDWAQVFTGDAGEFLNTSLVVGSTVKYRVRTNSSYPSEFVTSNTVLVLGAPSPVTVTEAAFVTSEIELRGSRSGTKLQPATGVLSFELLIPSSESRPASTLNVTANITVADATLTYTLNTEPFVLPEALPAGTPVSLTVASGNDLGTTTTTWSFTTPDVAPYVVGVEAGPSGAREVTLSWLPADGVWSVTREFRLGDGEFLERFTVPNSGSSTLSSLVAGSVVTFRVRYEKTVDSAGVPMRVSGVWQESNEVTVIDVPVTPTNVTAVADDGQVTVSWDDTTTSGQPVDSVVVESRRLDGPVGLNYDPTPCANVALDATCAFDVFLMTEGEVDVAGVGFSAMNPDAFTLTNVSFSTSPDCIREHQGANVAVACLVVEDLFDFARVTFARVTNDDLVPALGNATYLTGEGDEIDITAHRLDEWIPTWVLRSSDAGDSFTETHPRSGRSVEYRVKFVNAIGETDWVSTGAFIAP